MNWEVIAAIGQNEPAVSLEKSTPRIRIAFYRPDDPDYFNQSVLIKISKQLNLIPSQPCIDFLHLAITVYISDLSIPRDTSSDDGWTRHINISIPVNSPSIWNKKKRALIELLNFLTGDKWSFSFSQGEEYECELGDSLEHQPRVVCLFSGGLDSLCGAINLLGKKQKVALVSHHAGDSAKNFQKHLSDMLEEEFPELSQVFRFKISRPNIEGNPGENTQRSRSFLFMSLGLSVANAIGGSIPLHVPENGLISLNVPLTKSRSGSQSTRTTHPYYIKLLKDLVSSLGITNPIELPFRFLTKGEMLQQTTPSNILRTTVPLSISCAHPDQRRYRGLPPGGHCGYCFPCLIRRAATAYSGIIDSKYDDFDGFPPDYRTEGGRDYRALKMALERFRIRSRSMDFLEVLNSGPIDTDELDEYVEVYRRGMTELQAYYK
jgi:7-cyano-7-deazaguanine synthase in queuosine biosynthesis